MGLIRRSRPKIGLALGGGGARGFAHLGVIKALEDYGIEVDYICGTSAGSLAGAFLASGMKYEEMLHLAKTISIKDIRTSKVFFMPSKSDGLEAVINQTLGEIDIEDLKKPFSAIAVDLKSTKEICISKGSVAKAVAGSCAVPGIFVPVEFEGMLLADGGLSNTIPSDIPRYFGCDYVIAVDVNKSRLYGTDSAKVVDVMQCSLRILMKSNAVKGYYSADVMIAPETKRFKSTRTEGLEDMIDEGYRATVDQIDNILNLYKPKRRFKRKKMPEDDIEFYK